MRNRKIVGKNYIRAARRFRPHPLYLLYLQMMYIAVDVGGTHIRIAASPSLQDPNLGPVADIPVENNYVSDFEHIAIAIERLSQGNINGIGMGIPSVLNKEKNELRRVPNLQDWEMKPVISDFANRFGCRVVLENDATCAAIGEAYYGHGGGTDFYFITWSTGIGGTFIKYNAEEFTVMPSEPGHLVIEPEGILDTCGQHGCFEAYCSGKGIRDTLKKRPEELSDTEWVTIEKRFVQGLVSIIAITETRLIVFAGGIALNQPQRLKNINTLLSQTLKYLPVPELRLSKQGHEIPLYGALAIQMQ
jgi:predicted NBD/HSP70 family sugar kinase